MGRELRRKQSKKERKTVTLERIKEDVSPYEDIYKLLKTFGILLLVVLGIHFFTAVIITKEIELFKKFQKDNDEEIVKVQNSILAKNTFEQPEDEYYVYFYDFEEEDSNIASLISSKLTEKKVYKVNTKDAFNTNYVTKEENGNSSAKTLEELKVINPTLIKISADTIVEYYETVDAITTQLTK